MSYRNSLKLLISNFSVVWKQLLYVLIISFSCFGLAYLTFIPTINLLKAEGVVSEISGIFETIYTSPKNTFSTCQQTFVHLFDVIKANPSICWGSILGVAFFGYILFRLLKFISYYNVTYLMHMKMTSFVEVGFTRSLISNFTASLRYALSRLVYSFVFTLIRTLIIFIYLRYASGTLSILLGLFIIVTILIVLSAIEISLFTGHAVSMIEKGGEISAFKALLVGNKATFKKYPRIFSNSIMVALSILVLNVFLGLFTVGAGLIITIPTSIVFKCIFDLASYFGAKSERYYLSENTIAVSKDNKISSKE